MLWRLIIGAHKAEPLCATPPVYRIRGNILVTRRVFPAKLSIKIEEFCISYTHVLASHSSFGKEW